MDLDRDVLEALVDVDLDASTIAQMAGGDPSEIEARIERIRESTRDHLWPPEDLLQFCIDGGMSHQRLADLLGFVSREEVRQYLEASDSLRADPPDVSWPPDDMLQRWRDRGMSLKTIARQLECPEASVRARFVDRPALEPRDVEKRHPVECPPNAIVRVWYRDWRLPQRDIAEWIGATVLPIRIRFDSMFDRDRTTPARYKDPALWEQWLNETNLRSLAAWREMPIHKIRDQCWEDGILPFPRLWNETPPHHDRDDDTIPTSYPDTRKFRLIGPRHHDYEQSPGVIWAHFPSEAVATWCRIQGQEALIMSHHHVACPDGDPDHDTWWFRVRPFQNDDGHDTVVRVDCDPTPLKNMGVMEVPT